MNNRIKIISGDITKLQVEAIVNAANNSLMGGGGVDGAIHRAAGPELQKECEALNGCDTGEAKITKGYNLPAKYIIHTAGPIYGSENGQEKQLLENCYINSLKLAQEYGIRTIAFPAISTGVFGYPRKEATIIVKNLLNNYLLNDHFFREIILVLHSQEDFEIYNWS